MLEARKRKPAKPDPELEHAEKVSFLVFPGNDISNAGVQVLERFYSKVEEHKERYHSTLQSQVEEHRKTQAEKEIRQRERILKRRQQATQQVREKHKAVEANEPQGIKHRVISHRVALIFVRQHCSLKRSQNLSSFRTHNTRHPLCIRYLLTYTS